MGTVWNDTKHSLQMFRKNPGFAIAAIFALALGIGANSAIFSVVNAVLLKPLSYPNADRMVNFLVPLERGIRPRVLTRSAEKALSLFGDRVDAYVGDLAVPTSLGAAIQGANIVFLVNVGPEIPERDRAAAIISKDSRVQRIVKLSSLDVEQGLAIGAWHEKGEAAIRDVGIPFTFVRPTGFMSNLLAWAHPIRTEGVVRSSTADGRRPFIHSDDIASVCVAALLREEYTGRSLPITGPESLIASSAIN